MILRRCLALILAVTLLTQGWGQDSRLELANPYDAIWTHLHFLQVDSYNPGQAASAFPTEDSIAGSKAAIRLKQIYDGMGLYVHMNLLPQDQDYRDTLTGSAYYTPFPESLPQIYLEKQGTQWRYSRESMDQIPALFTEVFPFGTSRLVQLFSRPSQNKFLGVSTWQYLGIGILLLLAFVANFIFSGFSRWILARIGDRRLGFIAGYADYRSKLAKILSAIIVIWLVRTLLPILQLSANFNVAALVVCRIVLTAFVAWFFLTLLELIMAYVNRAATSTSNRMDDQIVPIVRRLAQIIIVIVAALHILRLLDVNITALIAGVSIGGLALALAAQDSVKNLLGSIMIFVDRPFQIGDWIEGSDFAGSVVEVGFRSTRIKTSDTSVISVPNGRMADATVKNMGVREFRLFSTSLGLTYDTTTRLIERFLEGIKQIIAMHPRVSNEGWYVNLAGMSASSLDIMVRAYIEVDDYASELQVRESLYLAILQWAEELGVAFAFPTQTLHLENPPENHPPIEPSPEELDERWERFRQKSKLDDGAPI